MPWASGKYYIHVRAKMMSAAVWVGKIIPLVNVQWRNFRNSPMPTGEYLVLAMMDWRIIRIRHDGPVIQNYSACHPYYSPWHGWPSTGDVSVFRSLGGFQLWLSVYCADVTLVQHLQLWLYACTSCCFLRIRILSNVRIYLWGSPYLLEEVQDYPIVRFTSLRYVISKDPIFLSFPSCTSSFSNFV